ncbi:MAG: GGDEF domain-containing protein [Vicinamibacteria bacterium]
MRFNSTLAFGRTLAWWPISALIKSRNRASRRVTAVWFALTIISIVLALWEAERGWSGLPIDVGSWTLGFTFYPPVSIGVLLTLLIGPGFGATTAYVSTLASGLYSGLSPDRAAFFALGSPIELLLLWFLILILRVKTDLRRVRDWGLFAAASLIAATASSVDIMLYTSAHNVTLAEGQRLWVGWILGDFAQMLLVVAPMLFLFGSRAHNWVASVLAVPPHREISTGRILVLLMTVWSTLGLLVFEGVRLLERALDIPDYAVTMSGDPLVQRLREMGVYVGVFVVVMIITTMALTAALAGVGDQHRELSLRDELTGCFNRRAFKRLYAREAERSAGLNRPISFVYFDIDHFKALNDRHGHETGDAVLASLARQATDILSAQELLFRWGGEEFLVLLSHTGREEARLFAERLRSRIEDTVFVDTAAAREAVTISVGVATGAPPNFDQAALIRSADAALYQAKASGRNRVVTDRAMGA